MSWGRVGILVETFIFILFFQVPQRFKCQTRDETFFYLQSLILKVSSWSLTSLIPLCQTPPNAYGPILHKIETKFTINSKPVFNQITYSYFVFLATFRFKFPYSLISKPLSRYIYPHHSLTFPHLAPPHNLLSPIHLRSLTPTPSLSVSHYLLLTHFKWVT